jgi:hypothetical protein
MDLAVAGKSDTMLAMGTSNQPESLIALGVGLIIMATLGLLIARPYSGLLESIRQKVKSYNWWVSLFVGDQPLNSAGHLRLNRTLCILGILTGLGLISIGTFQVLAR